MANHKPITKLETESTSHFSFSRLNKEQMELWYGFGYQAFQSGKYEDALTHFLFLRELEPTSYRNLYAIAVCYHRMKNYRLAISYYYACIYLDPTLPEPYLYLSDCYEKIGEVGLAIKLLEETLIYSSNPKYQRVNDKAQLELVRLKKIL